MPLSKLYWRRLSYSSRIIGMFRVNILLLVFFVRLIRDFFLVTGKVPPIANKNEIKADVYSQIGSGFPSPQFGMDVIIHGGVVRYGPWADRQRFVDIL